MTNKTTDTLLIVGGVGVAAYLLLSGKSAPGTSIVSTLQNVASSVLPGSGTTYPYLIPGAPGLPAAYNQAYYLTYIRPAMLAANGNINNPGYTLSQTDANNYLANYTDINEWAHSASVLKESQTGGTVLGAAQFHWHNNGVAEQRTFLPLPWNDPTQWVPPPVNNKSSGSGSTLSTIAEVAGIAAMFVGPEPVLNDTEINLVITSAAIIKKILPFYLEVEPDLVDSVSFKLDNLIAQYAD